MEVRLFQPVYQVHLYRSERGDLPLKPLPIVSEEIVDQAAQDILQSYHDNPQSNLPKRPLRGDVTDDRGKHILTVEIGHAGARTIWSAPDA